MATGLLLLVSGAATRLAPYFGGDSKTYEAEVTLGLESNTYDIEGEINRRHQGPFPGETQIVSSLQHFIGTFLQVPPAVSAKKIAGVPAYKMARQQRPVELPPVEVTVHELCFHGLDLGDPQLPKLSMRVRCSAGTYIRSIANDLGTRLGCGAVLSALRRTFVNRISVDDSFSLERLRTLARDGDLQRAIVPMSRMLPETPVISVDETTERQIRHGREFRASPFVVEPGAPLLRVLSRGGDLIALGHLIYPNVYHPKVVL